MQQCQASICSALRKVLGGEKKKNRKLRCCHRRKAKQRWSVAQCVPATARSSVRCVHGWLRESPGYLRHACHCHAGAGHRTAGAEEPERGVGAGGVSVRVYDSASERPTGGNVWFEPVAQTTDTPWCWRCDAILAAIAGCYCTPCFPVPLTSPAAGLVRYATRCPTLRDMAGCIRCTLCTRACVPIDAICAEAVWGRSSCGALHLDIRAPLA